MLIVLAHNDGTGTDAEANYDVTVRVNEWPIWQGRVEGHARSAGWAALLRLIADAPDQDHHER